VAPRKLRSAGLRKNCTRRQSKKQMPIVALGFAALALLILLAVVLIPVDVTVGGYWIQHSYNVRYVYHSIPRSHAIPVSEVPPGFTYIGDPSGDIRICRFRFASFKSEWRILRTGR
jgi:hypothetical protein